MIISLSLQEHSYDIVVERGILAKVATQLDLNRKVLIVTDDGVPRSYAQCVAEQCAEAHIVTLAQGEAHKTFASLTLILEKMLESCFTRKDCVVAVGGGIVGDVAGFAASMYMRGVDFYNIPTTLLSQVDSSIGGKTAINFKEIKNVVGAFYQPKRVLIDPQLLSTLPKRQIANGMAEAIKMALTSDAALFSLIEENPIDTAPDDLIVRSLLIKKQVVEQDERETGLRKILNFGHTVGHGIENQFAKNGLHHGECVALGMLCACSDSVKERLLPVLKKWSLPTEYRGDTNAVYEAMLHDKKGNRNTFDIVTVPKVGSCEIQCVSSEELRGLLRGLQPES